MKLEIAKCCSSCIHSSRPKQPDETHAAHYTVAKTERWCFKHNCHITRECVCDDFEGFTKAAKTCLSRVVNFNQRLKLIKEITELIGERSIDIGYYKFYKKDGYLCYTYGDSSFRSKVDSKSKNNDRQLKELLDILKK